MRPRLTIIVPFIARRKRVTLLRGLRTPVDFLVGFFSEVGMAAGVGRRDVLRSGGLCTEERYAGKRSRV